MTTEGSARERLAIRALRSADSAVVVHGWRAGVGLSTQVRPTRIYTFGDSGADDGQHESWPGNLPVCRQPFPYRIMEELLVIRELSVC